MPDPDDLPDAARLSLDSLPSLDAHADADAEPPQVNGHAHKPPEPPNGGADDGDGGPKDAGGDEGGEGEKEVVVQRLKEELERTREEKESLAAQYRNLLEKLTHMRNTLGNKLRQDAEELDRREQAISALTERAQTQDAELSALSLELQDQQDRTATLSSELALLRARTSTIDTLESELQVIRGERERDRLQREEEGREWERERMGWEREREAWAEREREWERARAEEHAWREKWEDERERAGKLEGVLQDFMLAKESEMRHATAELSAQLATVTQSLAEFKHRALAAESDLASSTTHAARCVELEKEVREKTLLIGKLRHEAVIINEHLTEALRRLRKSSSENSVDRRLITNTLLAFLSTPRADSKRFEMLSLLANVLGWNDAERERAGLQRTLGLGGGVGGGAGSGATPKKAGEKGKGRAVEEKDETESFSKMWVEFLLKESSQPLSPPPASASLPSHPSFLSSTSTSTHSPSPTPTSTSFPALISPGGSGSETGSPRWGVGGLPRVASFSALGMGMGNGVGNGYGNGNGNGSGAGRASGESKR